MPKTRNRRRFRRAPYAYSDSYLAEFRACCRNRSTVTSKDAGCKLKCILVITLTDDAIASDGNQSSTFTDVIKLTDTKAPENPNDSQSSTSQRSSPIDQASSAQASSAQASLGQASSSSTGTIVSNDPAPSSVTTRQATGTESNYHEVSRCILMGYL